MVFAFFHVSEIGLRKHLIINTNSSARRTLTEAATVLENQVRYFCVLVGCLPLTLREEPTSAGCQGELLLFKASTIKQPYLHKTLLYNKNILLNTTFPMPYVCIYHTEVVGLRVLL